MGQEIYPFGSISPVSSSFLASKQFHKKTDKEMSHKGIWWSECPGSVPGINFGTSQGHPGRLGRFMWKFTFKGQNVRGTDGTDDGRDEGTDGTQTRGCPAKILYPLGAPGLHL